MGVRYANFLKGTLQQSIAADATTIYIEPEEEEKLPAFAVDDYAVMVLYDQSLDPEIIHVTAHADGALTVTRAQEDTTAQAWPAGTIATNDITAATVEALASVGALARFTGTATGTNDITITAAGGSTVPAPTNGDEVFFQAAADNTGAVTITYTNGVDDIGPTALVHEDGEPLEAGDLQGGWFHTIRYHTGFSKWVLVSQGSYQLHASQINDGPLVSANQLSNGRFDDWHTATSFVDPVTATEVANGYYIEFDGTIGNFTISRQDFALGQTDVEGDPKHYLRWAHTSAGSGSAHRRLRTKVGRVHNHAGEKVIRSVYMKADASRNVTAKIIQHFGSGGSPSADVECESEVFALTTSWQRFDILDTLPSISGKTLGSGDDDALILSLDLPVNTTMTIEVAMDQFETGHIASKPGSDWPLDTRKGGTGRSYATFAALVAGIEAAISGGWLTQTEFDTGNPDLAAIEALAGTSGILAKTAASTWALRTFADTTGLTWTNPAGVAGNPSVALSSGLVNYHSDPMSVAELASITGTFGTAAFVADSTLAHLAGVETFTANKNFRGAVGAALLTFENTTTSHEMEVRFQSSGNLFELVPAPSGTADTAKGFGFDFATNRWQADVTLLLASGAQLIAPDGTAAAPSVRIGDEENGWYSSGANELSLSLAGSQRLVVSGTHLALSPGSLRLSLTDGSVSSPGMRFASETGSGIYRIGASNIGMAVSGALVFDWNATRLLMAAGFDLVLSSTVTPTSTHSAGFRGSPVTSGEKSGSYTGVGADMGGSVPFTAAATFTIPTNAAVAAPIGSTLHLPSLTGGGTITVHPDSGVTLRRGDGTAGTGDRSIIADSGATLWKRGTNEWYLFGPQA